MPNPYTHTTARTWVLHHVGEREAIVTGPPIWVPPDTAVRFIEAEPIADLLEFTLPWVKNSLTAFVEGERIEDILRMLGRLDEK